MDPLTLLAIGAGVGLLKSEAVDRPRERRQRKLAAETERLSPWTGRTPNPIQEADPLGSMLAFGLTGAQLGAGLQQHEMNQAISSRIANAPYAPVSIGAQAGPAMMPGGMGAAPMNPYAGALAPQAYGANPFGMSTLSSPYGGISRYGI